MVYEYQVPAFAEAPNSAVQVDGPITNQVIKLEKFLGDPGNSDSRINYKEQLALDQHEIFPQSSIDALDQWGFAAYYIPETEGGRLARFDEFVIMIRSIARRDLTVAIAHAKTFLGGIPIWIRGGQTLKAQCANLILAGHAIALGLTERAHGSDLFHNDCTLLQCEPQGYLLTGEKWLINNATRSSAITLHCNVSCDGLSKGSALALVVKSDLAADSFSHLPKERLLGIRGADISGIAFNRVPVDKQQVVGAVGAGLEIALLSLQLSRILCCGFALGAGDTALRITCHRFQSDTPQLIPRPAHIDILLSEGFCLQLAADCMTLIASRAVNVVPHQVVLISAIAKYLVPTTVEKIFDLTAQMYGLSSFSNEGLGAVFQKFRRDNRIVSLFDGSTIINLQSLVAQIRHIADSLEHVAQDTSDPLDIELLKKLFRISDAIPPIEFSKLRTAYADKDLVLWNLYAVTQEITSFDTSDKAIVDNINRIRELVTLLRTSYGELARQIREHPNRLNTREPAMFSYAKRYCDLYMAGCNYFIWHFNRDVLGPEFCRGDWLIRVLERALRCEAKEIKDGRPEIQAWMQRLYSDQLAFSIISAPAIFAPAPCQPTNVWQPTVCR